MLGATKSAQKKKGRKVNEDLDELWNELEAHTMDLVDDHAEEEEVFPVNKKKRKRVINDDDFSIGDPSTPT